MKNTSEKINMDKNAHKLIFVYNADSSEWVSSCRSAAQLWRSSLWGHLVFGFILGLIYPMFAQKEKTNS